MCCAGLSLMPISNAQARYPKPHITNGGVETLLLIQLRTQLCIATQNIRPTRTGGGYHLLRSTIKLTALKIHK
jgi:hypothetical protein